MGSKHLSRAQIDTLCQTLKALDPGVQGGFISAHMIRPDPDTTTPPSAALHSTTPHTATSLTATSPDGLALTPGLHEITAAGYLDQPAALAFQAGLMGQCLPPRRPLLWVRPRPGPHQDFGRPTPSALRHWNLDPSRILLVETDTPEHALWAMEDGLRQGAWVMGEVRNHRSYDLTASKRLHRLAQARTSLVLIHRPARLEGLSVALSRRRIAARPSRPTPWQGANGLFGLGAPRFHVHLERARGAPPQEQEYEWKHAAFHVVEPAPVADRPAQLPLVRSA